MNGSTASLGIMQPSHQRRIALFKMGRGHHFQHRTPHLYRALLFDNFQNIKLKRLKIFQMANGVTTGSAFFRIGTRQHQAKKISHLGALIPIAVFQQ